MCGYVSYKRPLNVCFDAPFLNEVGIKPAQSERLVAKSANLRCRLGSLRSDECYRFGLWTVCVFVTVFRVEAINLVFRDCCKSFSLGECGKGNH